MDPSLPLWCFSEWIYGLYGPCNTLSSKTQTLHDAKTINIHHFPFPEKQTEQFLEWWTQCAWNMAFLELGMHCDQAWKKKKAKKHLMVCKAFFTVTIAKHAKTACRRLDAIHWRFLASMSPAKLKMTTGDKRHSRSIGRASWQAVIPPTQSLPEFISSTVSSLKHPFYLRTNSYLFVLALGPIRTYPYLFVLIRILAKVGDSYLFVLNRTYSYLFVLIRTYL
jgi:hypothetical protein